MKEVKSWDSEKYDTHAHFVSEMALPLVEILKSKKNESILDLGCGEGPLALEIEKSGAKVVCVDLSLDMVKNTKQLIKLFLTSLGI